MKSEMRGERWRDTEKEKQSWLNCKSTHIKKSSHCCCFSGLLTASFEASCRTQPMTG